MKDTRPVNLDIGTMRLPVTAWASISHRISGVFLVAASAGMLWALDLSLSGPAGFARVADVLSSLPARLTLWVVLTGLLYHSLAGIRHLVMDLGIGESFRGGAASARLVFALTFLGAVVAGAWLLW